jgi:hypothetical protein
LIGKSLFPLAAIAWTVLGAASAAPSSHFTDTLVFGDAASEQAHGVVATGSDVVAGGLGALARRLLPQTPATWQGGTVSFRLKVDPAKRNYVTSKFWGGEANPDRLILFCDGKQIGFRPMGDIDTLDIGSEEPMYPGRFYYTTFPLPAALTAGKSDLACEIRATGPIWVYGTSFDQYQKPMTVPSRGLYKLFAHTEPYFVAPSDDPQGVPPPDETKTAPGPEVLDAVKSRVNGEIERLLAAQKPPTQMETVFLARSWRVAWTAAYQNPAALDKVLAGLDEAVRNYHAKPDIAHSDPSTPNADWFGYGCYGQTLMLIGDQLGERLDEKIDDGSGSEVVRRVAYSAMLVDCRDWHRKHRRLYSNQTMINDLYGIYLANRGVAAIDPPSALSEPDARRYLYESVGLERWRDSDPGGTGAAEVNGRNWGVGSDYWELTDKGLTRELGFVGNYGEVLDWVSSIYRATAPTPGRPGDPKILAQLIKIANARAVFRYPTTDEDGKRAMRLETVIGWRDTHYPGDVAYGQRASWDAGPFDVAAVTLDPDLVGYAQQMLEDNQFFAAVVKAMGTRNLRATAGLLDTPDEYAAIKAAATQSARLPMSPGQPDFVFTDEQDGVVALKHDGEIFYASLYWRAHKGVNDLARIHLIRQNAMTIATVEQTSVVDDSGMVYRRADNVNPGFGLGSLRYPGDLHSAHAGEALKIAKIPPDIAFKPGDDNVYAGKADFYTLRYGPYLIGMNMTKDKTFTIDVPAAKPVTELVTKATAGLAGTRQTVKPRSTVVYYLGE